MHMIVMALHCKDLKIVLPAHFCHQCFEVFIYARNVEYFSAVAGAENEMIIQQRNCRICASVCVFFHIRSIACNVAVIIYQRLVFQHILCRLTSD